MENPDSRFKDPKQIFRLPEKLENSLLYQIIENSHDGIIVTDNTGQVLLANTAAAQFMNRTVEDLVGYNVRLLLERGFYSNSTILETVRTGLPVTKLITIPISGKKVMSTSIPIMNENKSVNLIVTTTINQDLVDSYVDAIEQEKNNSEKYKSAANYLDELESRTYDVVFKSEKMKRIIKEVSLIARTDSTILITGESGTGKEVIARFVHRNSGRSREPFIPVNCAAIPEELMESEFFGYEKGAFSGANAKGKLGFFEIADRGTLFLDEIGELSLNLQSKLLRVLETGEFQRIGGTTIKKSDVRLVSATNKDLAAMVRNGVFREDLYYRLNVIPVFIPPLRERPEDIIKLSDKFLEEFNIKFGTDKIFSRSLLVKFLNYRWPGNARELKNLIERLVIISSGKELNFNFDNDFQIKDERIISENKEPEKVFVPLKEAVKTYERKYIEQVIETCNGNISAAADRLGIHRTMIYRKLNAPIAE